MFFKNIPPRRRGYIKFGIVLALYLLFLYWVGSWWGLLVVPFIYDVYVSKFINWGWWKNSKNRTVRLVMSWVDAIVFALVAIYFLNQFFFQNFVIPSSSLEKTLLTGDYLLFQTLLRTAHPANAAHHAADAKHHAYHWHAQLF